MSFKSEDWGESVCELMIKKTVTRNCTQYSFTWVFLTFVHVVFKVVSCVLLLVLSCVVCDCCWLAVCIVVFVLYMRCYLMCICCFSWFPCVYKQMLRWFSKFQVATTCFSCSPPDLNLVVTNFMFCIHVT